MTSSTIPIHEFKSRLSHYLAQARGGHPVEITAHRKVVARVIGVPDGEAAVGFARLVATGLAQWGGGKPQGGAVRLTPSAGLLSAQVIEDR